MAQIGALAGLYERGNVPSAYVKDEILTGRLLASPKFSVVMTLIISVFRGTVFCSVIRQICLCFGSDEF